MVDLDQQENNHKFMRLIIDENKKEKKKRRRRRNARAKTNLELAKGQTTLVTRCQVCSLLRTGQ